MFTRKQVSDIILEILKKEAVKTSLRKLAITGGLKTYILTYIVEELFEEIVAPILLLAERKVHKVYDKQRGGYYYVKFKKAVDTKDWDKVKSISDDMRS